MKTLSKRELKLISELKLYGSIEISKMSDMRNRTLGNLCIAGICRYEMVEYRNSENRPLIKIIYTLI